jgi:hypothetical protein
MCTVYNPTLSSTGKSYPHLRTDGSLNFEESLANKAPLVVVAVKGNYIQYLA